MSVSLPSHEVCALDIPEVRQFTAEFRYNFFTPDESVEETGGIPVSALSRPTTEVDASFIQYAVSRVPRYVLFNFTPPILSDPGKKVSEGSLRKRVFGSGVQNGSLIQNNIQKIVTEDNFTSENFAAVNFQDGEIDTKVYYLVSGSFVQRRLGSQDELGSFNSAMKLNAATPDSIPSHFLASALSNTQKNNGAQFLDETSQDYYDNIKRVMVNCQVNGKLFNNMIKRAIDDPFNPFAGDIQPLSQFAAKLQQTAQRRARMQVSEADYKTVVPYVSVQATKSGNNQNHAGPEIVGYIIDKAEISRTGQVKVHPPIIVENSQIGTTADFRIKYGTNYVYSIRSVAQFTLPAINSVTGETAIIKMLVSSKPSPRIYVETAERIAPPPPADLNFTWDYERVNPTTADQDLVTGQPVPGTGQPGSLLIHWTFPPNSQRDVKKFQVFRRKSVAEPFELLKMYDFDDSMVKYPNLEEPNPKLVEYLTSPCSFYFEDDFTRNSKYIYAVACVDAHGYTSNFSAQFEVWFDIFKNQLQKRLVSHSGAPKPYPNLYLQNDLFVDTIRVSGANNKKIKLYFNPEYYQVYDSDGRYTDIVSTKQAGGSYKLQFVNLDNQKNSVLTIRIDDQREASPSTLSVPQVNLGPRKKPSGPVY